MNDREKALLQQEILKLETQIAAMQVGLDSVQEKLDSVKESIKHIKDIAWDRESKKESNKMFKVLENEKPSTIVRSNVGDVIIDSELIQKEKEKHLDNPALRGMVTKEEFLSFPKVARNVEAETDKKHKNFTWKVKANDESVIAYGSREYVKDDKEINRLLTTHSKTESNERTAEVDRRGHPYHSIFNDFNFRTSASETIPQDNKNTGIPSQKVSDSALAKMKQKCEDYAKRLQKNSPKSQTKDKGDLR